MAHSARCLDDVDVVVAQSFAVEFRPNPVGGVDATTDRDVIDCEHTIEVVRKPSCRNVQTQFVEQIAKRLSSTAAPGDLGPAEPMVPVTSPDQIRLRE